MAKVSNSNKVTFGARKKGSAKKTYNKHNKRPKIYIGQGRIN